MRIARTHAIPALLAAALLLAAAAPALARTPVRPRPLHFQASFQGTGSYAETTTSPDGISSTASASFTWHTVFPSVLFSRIGGAATASRGSTYGGTWSVSLPLSDPPCSGSGGFGNDAPFPAGLELRKSGSRYVTTVHGLPSDRLSELPVGAQDCGNVGGSQGPNFWGDWMGSYSKVGSDPLARGVTAVTAQVVLPVSQLTTRPHLSEHVGPQLGDSIAADCNTGDGSCSQSYTWSGTITWTRLRR